MSIRTFVIAAVALAGVAVPVAASAQRYGYHDGPSRYERAYGGNYGRRYDDRSYRYDDRRQRWEERRRWREIQRHRAWELRHRRDRYDERYYRY